MANAVRVARVLKGKTLKELSAASGVGYTTLSRLENGLHPSRKHVQRIARALDVRATDLERAIQLANE